MKEKQICSECGKVLAEDEVYEFDDHILCEDCWDEKTVVCDCCSRRVWREDSEKDGQIIICTRCYENHYTTCEDCGRYIRYDDALYEDGSDYPYCQSCYARLKRKPIKPYSYKPEPIFYGSGNFYMGVELEVDGGGEDSQNAQNLLNVANQKGEHIYIKHDGSLNDGFELVTHPMTPEYHYCTMPWQEVLKEALELDYRSHQTSTCGLHIHCNRSVFGRYEYEQEEKIGRIVYFLEKHWCELVNFSRRSTEALNRWAARYATISQTPKETYEKAKRKRMGRYVALNLSNEETIEFRLFRGTLRYDTLIATLQLVELICNLAICSTDEELERLSWSEFVLKIPEDKHELIQYLKTRRLYVNDAAQQNEEV